MKMHAEQTLIFAEAAQAAAVAERQIAGGEIAVVLVNQGAHDEQAAQFELLRHHLADSRDRRAYLIVDHRRRRVDRYWREVAGEWQREDLVTEGRVPIPCLDVELTLDEIYERVRIRPPSKTKRRVRL